jgi:hypothetical protein
MKKFISFILVSIFFSLHIAPILAVDDIYKLSEVYTPGSKEVEESRTICIYPFRNAVKSQTRSSKSESSDLSSDEYLARGIPAILVTETRKMGLVYDENVVTEVVRHQMGKNDKKKKKEKVSTLRQLQDGGLDPAKKRKLEYTDEEWDDILTGKKELKPAEDPRYIPLKVQFFRSFEYSPEKEEAFRLGYKNKCFYVVTGEFNSSGEDRLVSTFELTFLWDGKVVTQSHQTSFIRAFQEMNPLAEKLKKSLVNKDFSIISVSTGSRSGALVFLDDVYIGKTPVKNYPTTLGKHEILVTEKGYEEIREEFNLTKNSPKNFSFILKPLPKDSYISVASDPPGAEVYLGIEKLGETPLNKVKVPVGKNRLRVSKEDHIDYFTGVDQKEGINHKHSVTLRSGNSEIYYKNRDYVFLDYTYKEFSTFSLWSALIFYAGHIYYQVQARNQEESVRANIQIVNYQAFQDLSAQNPNAAFNRFCGSNGS